MARRTNTTLAARQRAAERLRERTTRITDLVGEALERREAHAAALAAAKTARDELGARLAALTDMGLPAEEVAALCEVEVSLVRAAQRRRGKRAAPSDEAGPAPEPEPADRNGSVSVPGQAGEAAAPAGVTRGG